MNRRRNILRAAFIVVAAVASIWAVHPPDEAFGQMDRTGTVGITSDTERQLFWSLLCTCGCPRETLGTCTCAYGHERRTELRQELAAGKDIETIKAEYASRFGSAALAVPPNKGSQRFVWIVPLVAIIAGAFLVARFLKRWVKPSEAAPSPAPRAGKKAAKEAAPTEDDKKYDDKLDEELKALDRE